LSRPQTITGLLVLIAGVFVVYAATPGPEVEPVAGPAVVTVDAIPAPEAHPGLGDVAPVVQRVLFASGKAETLGVDQLTELPPEVARVLIQYGATLAIATQRRVEG